MSEPVVMSNSFLLTLFYTHHESNHFYINFACLAVLVVAKTPQMHGVC